MCLQTNIASFQYSAGRTVLSGIEFEMEQGDSLAVLGGSGCGKSTMLRIIAGLLPKKPEHRFTGSVSIDGHSPQSYRRSGNLAFMFQEPSLLPNRTVIQNVSLPLELQSRTNGGGVEELLEIVGLSAFGAYLPNELSGGMRTRVALARTFVTEPKVLLLDEPFGSLDIWWKQELYASMTDLKRRYDSTVVMVTHDLLEAVYNSNNILVLGPNGVPLDLHVIDSPFPRPFAFRETVAKFVPHLEHLARLLTRELHPSGKNVENTLRILDEREPSLWSRQSPSTAK